MAEYIEREAILGILRGRSAPWDGYQKVKELPAADVVPMDFHERCLQIEIQKRMALEKADVRPVVRGKWIEEDDGTLFYRCSACGKASYGLFTEIYMGDVHYCPNCGADMRAEEGEA